MLKNVHATCTHSDSASVFAYRRWWHANWKLRICKRCIHVRKHVWAPDLYAQLVIINKISASELSRKLNKSALLVGHVYVKSLIIDFFFFGQATS